MFSMNNQFSIGKHTNSFIFADIICKILQHVCIMRLKMKK